MVGCDIARCHDHLSETFEDGVVANRLVTLVGPFYKVGVRSRGRAEISYLSGRETDKSLEVKGMGLTWLDFKNWPLCQWMIDLIVVLGKGALSPSTRHRSS